MPGPLEFPAMVFVEGMAHQNEGVPGTVLFLQMFIEVPAEKHPQGCEQIDFNEKSHREF